MHISIIPVKSDIIVKSKILKMSPIFIYYKKERKKEAKLKLVVPNMYIPTHHGTIITIQYFTSTFNRQTITGTVVLMRLEFID